MLGEPYRALERSAHHDFADTAGCCVTQNQSVNDKLTDRPTSPENRWLPILLCVGVFQPIRAPRNENC